MLERVELGGRARGVGFAVLQLNLTLLGYVRQPGRQKESIGLPAARRKSSAARRRRRNKPERAFCQYLQFPLTSHRERENTLMFKADNTRLLECLQRVSSSPSAVPKHCPSSPTCFPQSVPSTALPSSTVAPTKNTENSVVFNVLPKGGEEH